MQQVHRCKYCGEEHRLQYLDAVNGAVHLVYRCTNKKGLPTVFLPFVSNLPLAHTVRKKDLKQKTGESLFDFNGDRSSNVEGRPTEKLYG